MCASKTIFASPDPTPLHFPAVSKKPRRLTRRSPTSSVISVPLSNVATNVSENVSALKEKYTGYASWLKATARQNREPAFTHELLKHSLCEMGIDPTQATQLVSTCTWYVYQFQKGLGSESEQRQRLAAAEAKKSQQSAKKRLQKKPVPRSSKPMSPREPTPESEVTFHSASKETLLVPGSHPVTRNKYAVLPSIPPADPSLSPRTRRVDFGTEQLPRKQKSAHRPSAMTKTRVLPKLRPPEAESTISFNEQSDVEPENPPIDPDASNANKTLRRPSVVVPPTRSILRKQTLTNANELVPDANTRKQRNRLLSPTPSMVVDEVPLGTKSQQLFGGSAYFAQILNEMEGQNLY